MPHHSIIPTKPKADKIHKTKKAKIYFAEPIYDVGKNHWNPYVGLV
jgi:hypothetical protein